MTVLEIIKHAIKNSEHKSITNVAPKIGLTYDQLGHMLNGRQVLTDHVLVCLRDVLAKDEEWPYNEIEGVRSLGGTPLAPVKVLNDMQAIEKFPYSNTEESFAYVPESVKAVSEISWIAEDDSFMPHVQPIDFLGFTPSTVKKQDLPFLLSSPDGKYRMRLLRWESGGWRQYGPNAAEEPLGTWKPEGHLVAWYRAEGRKDFMLVDADGLKIHRIILEFS